MTAGNNGSDAPENDDPFAYLYRQEGDQGGQAGQTGAAAPRTGGYGYPGPAAPHQPGVPRTSYNQVRAVGERTYGGQQQLAGQGPYGQGHGQQGQGYGPGAAQPGYGRTNAHYAAPETLPGGAPRHPAPGGGHGGGQGGGRGPNVRGLLIGAIAVVAVVVTGIGVALLTNGPEDDKKPQTQASNQPTGAESVKPSEPAAKPDKPKALPSGDSSALTLSGGTVLADTIKGASSKSGRYIAGFNQPGAAASWEMDLEDGGKYTLFVEFTVPGKDANATLTVNGKPQGKPLNMKNFAKATEGKWEDGWTHTYAWIDLSKGPNTIKLSCEQGNACDFALDRVSLKKGEVTG